MTDKLYSHHETAGAPLKLWDRNGPFETGAMEQLHNVAKLPFIYKHVAGMPDVHWGMGSGVSRLETQQGAVHMDFRHVSHNVG